MCMERILRTLLHWRRPDGGMVSQPVTPGERVAAPPEIAPGVTVTVEHVEAEPTDVAEGPDVAPEAPGAMGGSNLPPATAGLPHEP
jgi:hypothetical protein